MPVTIRDTDVRSDFNKKLSYHNQIAHQHSWSTLQTFTSHLVWLSFGCYYSYCVRAGAKIWETDPWNVGVAYPPERRSYTTRVITKSRRPWSNRFSVIRGPVRKFLGMLGPRPWDVRRSWPLETRTLLAHVLSHQIWSLSHIASLVSGYRWKSLSSSCAFARKRRHILWSYFHSSLLGMGVGKWWENGEPTLSEEDAFPP